MRLLRATSSAVTASLSLYLDVVRLLAAMLVALGHAYTFTGGHFKMLAGHGTTAVSVFFVLSGFVIAFVTEKKERNGMDYLVSRLARMYSVALPAIAITIAADYIGYNADNRPYLGLLPNTLAGFKTDYLNLTWSVDEILRLTTFTNELWTSHIQVGSGEPYWSLGFEVWYYIIFGLYHFGPGSKSSRLTLSFIAAIIAGPKICAYLPLWLMGVYCYRRMASPTPPLSTLPTWSVVALFLATPIIYLGVRHQMAPMSQSMFRHADLSLTVITSIAYFHIVGVVFCLNLVAFQQITTRLRKLETAITKYKKTIQWLAGATFTLYLIHQPILLMFLAINPLKEQPDIWAYTSFSATVFLVFVIAQFTERKKDVWKRFFSSLLRKT